MLRARLEGQAPDIDPLVYLTECDPSELTAGEFIQAEIVGSRDYDLVARPSDRWRSCEVYLSRSLARSLPDGQPSVAATLSA